MNLHWHPVANEGGGIYGDESDHGPGEGRPAVAVENESEQPGNAAVWVDGERTTAAREDAGEFLTAWAARYGFADIGEAMAAVSEVEEKIQPETVDPRAAHITQTIQFFKNAIRIIRGDGMDVRAAYDRLHYFMLAMRWTTELGGIDSAAELGRVLKVSKSNATKYETVFRDVLPSGMAQMPLQPGQRKQEHRRKFSQTRIEKLKRCEGAGR